MRRSLVASLLVGALLAIAGCGVVESSARRAVARVFGEGAASWLGGEGEDGTDPASDRPEGLTIAADEAAAEAIAEEGEEDEGAGGGSGFYKIVEPNGTVRFLSNLSELPVEERANAKRLAMAPSKPSAAPRARPALPKLTLPLGGEPDEQPPAARSRSGNHEVVLYTTTWCGWCKRTIAWLEEQGVEYVNKDVERDEAAAAEMRELTGGESGVPVVVIDGEVIQGFNQQRMKKLLQI